MKKLIKKLVMRYSKEFLPDIYTTMEQNKKEVENLKNVLQLMNEKCADQQKIIESFFENMKNNNLEMQEQKHLFDDFSENIKNTDSEMQEQ